MLPVARRSCHSGEGVHDFVECELLLGLVIARMGSDHVETAGALQY